jgi:hypothetical protein
MLDNDFLAGARIALELLDRDEVADRWDSPSVLERMTVGMLACHLGRQFVRVEEILPAPASGEPLDAADEHYRRAAWVTAPDLDDPSQDRTLDETDASVGAAAMRDRSRSALSAVTGILHRGEAQDVVTIPWQGWSLQRPDFLLTRAVEIVTHSDDLARSVGVPTPDFPAAFFHPVAHLLVRLAAERHGQAAVTSALTRQERMPRTISAF